ncbi:hypothetical protein GCM10023142_35750 [Anaerocolumna aminovalerica]|uniref:Uncharacterized protein n=1 Tax=Anaerocolumna aminovalerica TaxID=1527 RepID=A0A1I5JAZ8_9FIRM|nr:hypothetical protein SAMN04489757_1744 [Anaerocolumna aminovalerica]
MIMKMKNSFEKKYSKYIMGASYTCSGKKLPVILKNNLTFFQKMQAFRNSSQTLYYRMHFACIFKIYLKYMQDTKYTMKYL